MNNNYTPFNRSSEILYKYETGLEWTQHYGWDALEIAREVWEKESLLSLVDKEFPINRVAVLRTDPYQNYLWHRDDYRGVTINMLLKHSKSYCLFGSSKDTDNMYFEELVYTPNTFFLFNTQKLHTVINFDDYRYMISVEFKDDKSKLNYFDVYWWSKRQNLLEVWPSG